MSRDESRRAVEGLLAGTSHALKEAAEWIEAEADRLGMDYEQRRASFYLYAMLVDEGVEHAIALRDTLKRMEQPDTLPVWPTMQPNAPRREAKPVPARAVQQRWDMEGGPES